MINSKKASRMTMTKSPLQVDCCYCDYDGELYGVKAVRFVILEYSGKRNIRSLEIYPQHFDEDPQTTEAKLLARGKKYVSCGGISHRAYAGRDLADDRTNADIEDVSKHMFLSC